MSRLDALCPPRTGLSPASWVLGSWAARSWKRAWRPQTQPYACVAGGRDGPGAEGCVQGCRGEARSRPRRVFCAVQNSSPRPPGPLENPPGTGQASVRSPPARDPWAESALPQPLSPPLLNGNSSGHVSCTRVNKIPVALTLQDGAQCGRQSPLVEFVLATSAVTPPQE